MLTQLLALDNPAQSSSSSVRKFEGTKLVLATFSAGVFSGDPWTAPTRADLQIARWLWTVLSGRALVERQVLPAAKDAWLAAPSSLARLRYILRLGRALRLGLGRTQSL